MALSDEERLVAVANECINRWLKLHHDSVEEDTAALIGMLRAKGITLIPPPAPEPTYTIRLTADEREWLTEHVGWNEWQRHRKTIAVKLRNATPDEDTDGADGR